MLEVGKLYKINNKFASLYVNQLFGNKIILLLKVTLIKNPPLGCQIKYFSGNKIRISSLCDEELEYFEEVC